VIYDDATTEPALCRNERLLVFLPARFDASLLHACDEQHSSRLLCSSYLLSCVRRVFATYHHVCARNAIPRPRLSLSLTFPELGFASFCRNGDTARFVGESKPCRSTVCCLLSRKLLQCVRLSTLQIRHSYFLFSYRASL
jgi:hypothetical protein